MSFMCDENLMKNVLMNQRKKNFPVIKLHVCFSYNILEITRFRSIKCLKSFKRKAQS